MLTSVIAFVGAAGLVAMVPGPSTVVIVRQTVTSGRRSGLAAIAGNEVGVLFWGVAAALGLTALLTASRLAYESMRIAGAVFLIVFGVRALWRARRPAAAALAAADPGTTADADAGVGAGRGRSFRLGVLTNLANPKAGVFAVSFLPQFVPPGASVAATLLLLSVLWVLIDMVWYSGLVWLVGGAARFLGASGLRRRLEQVSGVVLVGLGVRLAIEPR